MASERSGHLIDAITDDNRVLRFDEAAGAGQEFTDLVMARIVQPWPKLHSVEPLAEIGVASASYAAIQRRLPTYAETGFRDRLTAASAVPTGIGPGVFVLYDVTTLHFETGECDDFRQLGFFTGRWLEPHTAVGLFFGGFGFQRVAVAVEGSIGWDSHDVVDAGAALRRLPRGWHHRRGRYRRALQQLQVVPV